MRARTQRLVSQRHQAPLLSILPLYVGPRLPKAARTPAPRAARRRAGRVVVRATTGNHALPIDLRRAPPRRWSTWAESISERLGPAPIGPFDRLHSRGTRHSSAEPSSPPRLSSSAVAARVSARRRTAPPLPTLRRGTPATGAVTRRSTATHRRATRSPRRTPAGRAHLLRRPPSGRPSRALHWPMAGPTLERSQPR